MPRVDRSGHDPHAGARGLRRTRDKHGSDAAFVVSVQVRLKSDGRPRDVVNIDDASRMAVVRFTIQPGVRFPWHSHPGLVFVAVTKGDLVFVYGDDCVQRRYPMGTAFVDPGIGNVHYAFNPTGGELVIVATFLGVPNAPAALTNPVAPEQAAALDAKCGAVAALAQYHAFDEQSSREQATIRA